MVVHRDHFRSVVEDALRDGRLAYGESFRIGPGLGYDGCHYGIWCGGRPWTNMLKSKEQAQHYLDGYTKALADASADATADHVAELPDATDGSLHLARAADAFGRGVPQCP